MSNYLICLFFLPLFLFGQSDTAYILPYQLDSPLRQMELSEKLNEISGLSIDSHDKYLVAVQDEAGSLFYLNKETGEIVKEVSFWKEGDYEGVELVGEDVFVVKNTGTLYQIKDVGEKNQSVIKYNDFLNSDNNIEGLTYWPQENKLLLACKSQPGKGMNSKQEKAIYAFDLESNSFNPSPLIVVERSIVGDYLARCKHGPNHVKICDLFDASKEEFKLTPAAVAIHPITEQLYVLSSKGNLLITINMSGEVLHIAKLPKGLHHQPEGICFDTNGVMYISNEQRNEHKANVVVYGFLEN